MDVIDAVVSDSGVDTFARISAARLLGKMKPADRVVPLLVRAL